MLTRLRIFKRYWLSITLITVLSVALGGLASLLSPQVFSANTSLFFSVKGVSSALDMAQGSNYAESQVRSIAAAVEKPFVLQPVIDELHLQTSPEELAQAVTATVPPGTVVINIAVQDRDPAQAALIANSIAAQTVQAVTELSATNQASSVIARATVLAPAGIPQSPTSPNLLLNLGLGLLVGLLVAMAQALLRELLNTRITDIGSLSSFRDVGVLGEISFDADARQAPLTSNSSRSTQRAEDYRRLRTNLLYASLDGTFRTVLVTASLAGEGTSTTALNLAWSLAQTGKSTLLIDANLRDPALATYSTLQAAPGLSTVLTGQSRLPDSVQVLGDNGLSVLTSGPVPPNPSELLDSRRMTDLLVEARTSYDAVILDSSALHSVADAAILAGKVDGVVIVARSGLVRRPQLAQALDALTVTRANVLGLVLNAKPS